MSSHFRSVTLARLAAGGVLAVIVSGSGSAQAEPVPAATPTERTIVVKRQEFTCFSMQPEVVPNAHRHLVGFHCGETKNPAIQQIEAQARRGALLPPLSEGPADLTALCTFAASGDPACD